MANQETSQENIDMTKKQALASLMNFHLKKREVEKYKISANQNLIESKLLSISSNNINKLKKNFSPYCSVATWYLWRSIDNEPIQY